MKPDKASAGIVLTKTKNGIHAHIEGDDKVSGLSLSGNVAEAIGDMVRRHPDRFCIAALKWDTEDWLTRVYISGVPPD